MALIITFSPLGQLSAQLVNQQFWVSWWNPDVPPPPPRCTALSSSHYAPHFKVSSAITVTKTSDVQGLSLQEHKSLGNTTTCLHVIRLGAARCSNFTVWRSSRSVLDETSFATLNIRLIINQNLRRGTTENRGFFFWTHLTSRVHMNTHWSPVLDSKNSSKGPWNHLWCSHLNKIKGKNLGKKNKFRELCSVKRFQ